MPGKTKIVLAGGTGFIGSFLTKRFLENGYELTLLSRQPLKSASFHSYRWNPERGTIPYEALEDQDIIINMSGAGIADKPWTKKRRRTIIKSRTESTRLLVKSISKLKSKPKHFINASAIGYYGDRPFEILNETSCAGNGFLSDVCVAWEKELAPLHGILDYSIVRIGIVLAKEGGSFPKLIAPFQYGINSIFGNGKQEISWIHIEDLYRIFYGLLNGKIKPGILNATTPNPVAMHTFNAKYLSLKKKYAFRTLIPKLPLKIILGEYVSLFYNSQHVVPINLLDQGFAFQYSHIEDAFSELIKE